MDKTLDFCASDPGSNPASVLFYCVLQYNLNPLFK